METRIVETKSIGRRPTAVLAAELEVGEIGPWLGATYSQIATYLEASGNPPIGPPIARYHPLGGGRFHVEAGFVVGRTIDPSSRIRGSSLPGGTVAVTTHIGPYDEMESTYEALATWLESRGATPSDDAWEIYFSEPSDPPSTWRTEIVQPYRTI